MSNNWVLNENANFLKKEAERELKKAKDQRKGKRFVMVKVCDKPLTYKEIEVNDEEK